MQKLVEYSAFIAIVNRLRNNGNISQKEYEEIRNKINKNAEKKDIICIEKEMFLFHHMSNLD